jgi:hypothetical protein
MPSSNTPKDGDFAAFLEHQHNHPIQHEIAHPPVLAPHPLPGEAATPGEIAADAKAYADDYEAASIAADLAEAKELAELEQITEEALEVTDEELERQALEHPGLDGDPSTPE